MHPGPAARWEATAQINVTAVAARGNQRAGAWSHQFRCPGRGQCDRPAGGAVRFRQRLKYRRGRTWKAAQTAPANWPQTNFNDSAWTTAESNSGTPWGTPALNDIARVPAPYLRKTFTVRQTVTRATVYVTALGAYELRLNGQKVGNDVLTPGWTQFTKRVYYQTYDVTGMVQPGPNTIGAILGDGWYASVLAFKGTASATTAGRRDSWPSSSCNFPAAARRRSSPILRGRPAMARFNAGDLLMGSEYDARLEMPGWDTTNFNDSAWSPVATGLSAAAVGYYECDGLRHGVGDEQSAQLCGQQRHHGRRSGLRHREDFANHLSRSAARTRR